MATKRKSSKRGPVLHDFTEYRAMLTAIYVEDADGFTGTVEELIGVSVHGRTLEEARERLEQAARDFVDENRSVIRSRMQPRRGPVQRETFVVEY